MTLIQDELERKHYHTRDQKYLYIILNKLDIAQRAINLFNFNTRGELQVMGVTDRTNTIMEANKVITKKFGSVRKLK